MTVQEDSIWKKRFERERKLKKQTEKLLEEKSRSLYIAQQKLLTQVGELEQSYEELNAMNTRLQQSEEELRTNLEEIQKMKEVLEERVKERTLDLDAKNSALENLISQLKATQTQLVHSEKMSSLGQLTAGIAHEINNPLNFVNAGVDTLKIALDDFMSVVQEYEKIGQSAENTLIQAHLQNIEEIKKEVEYEETKEDIFDLVGSIKDGATRTMDIIQGLRNFSRLDEDDIKRADIHDSLDNTIRLLHHKIHDAQISIEKNYQATNPTLDCFPGQLNQVFMNILANAIQAVVGKPQAKITLETENQGEFFYVHIQDNGIGIPANKLDKIFDPFFTTKDVGQGTGLGLSISYGIIQKHKGSIEVKSQEGVGTTFTIKIPDHFLKEM